MTAGPGPYRLRLPATSANLGPGFDAIGLAFSMFLEVEAGVAEEFAVEATGRDAAVTGALDDNLILMTYREVLGAQGLAAPALRVRVANDIPLGMGCGSSAAALCAGVLLANHFGSLRWTADQVLDEAARREGHPDNVAACLRGGLTVARTMWVEDGRTSRTVAATFGLELGWRLLLALPTASLATKAARALLPDSYSRADAVLNVQTTALLVSAFAMGRRDLLTAATEDRLHQPYRLAACPLLGRLLPMVGTPGVCSVTLSGAGPSVLLIVEGDFDLERLNAGGAGDLAEVVEVRIAGGVQESWGVETGN